jgi:hypothetical protein
LHHVGFCFCIQYEVWKFKLRLNLKLKLGERKEIKNWPNFHTRPSLHSTPVLRNPTSDRAPTGGSTRPVACPHTSSCYHCRWGQQIRFVPSTGMSRTPPGNPPHRKPRNRTPPSAQPTEPGATRSSFSSCINIGPCWSLVLKSYKSRTRQHKW